MKSAFYFSHDQNARCDEKIIPLLRAHGWAGYGLYWALVEKMYESSGTIVADFEMLAFDLRADAKLVESIATKFCLFYIKKGRIGSLSVDRRLAERQSRVEAAREAGIKSGQARAERALNGRSTDPELERKERKKERNTAAPSAADLSKASYPHVNKLGITSAANLETQLPFSFGDIPKGRRVIDIDPTSCRAILDKAARLGLDLRRALEARIKIKQSELHPQLRSA